VKSLNKQTDRIYREAFLQRAETDHFPFLFVVQAQSQQAEARPDCCRFDCLKSRNVIVALLQVVIGKRRSVV
jgi:hypothetical protein